MLDEGFESPGPGADESCELPRWCWEPTLAQQEQKLLLTAEPLQQDSTACCSLVLFVFLEKCKLELIDYTAKITEEILRK